MDKEFLILISIFIFILTANAVSASDVSVWQGQYFTGTTFNTGTFAFNFTVYDAEALGSACYSNVTSLTTGNFGEWKTEQSGVGAGCNNASKDYFLEIAIDNATQSPRRRLTSFNFLRKDASETIDNPMTFNAAIIGSTLQITAPAINNTVNQSGFVRNVIKNLDNGTGTSIINSLENDQGYQFSMALTSSSYNLTRQFEGENRSNVGTISLNAPNTMQFLIRYSYPFIWRIAENGTLTPQTEIMKLYPNGNLSVIGNITGNAGFFSYLGNLADRISKLWVVDIGASGNINASNYTLNGTTIDDWSDVSGISPSTDTVWNIIGSRYLYNNSGILDVNETKLNNTIDSKINGISSSGNGWVNDSIQTNTSLSVNVEGNVTINNAQRYQARNTSGGIASIFFIDSQNKVIFGDASISTQNAEFYSGGTLAMTLNTSGNVGIGTTTPVYTLQVADSAAGKDVNLSGVLYVNSNNDEVDIGGELNVSGISGDGSGKVVCVKSDGNLGTCSGIVGIGGTCTCA